MPINRRFISSSLCSLYIKRSSGKPTPFAAQNHIHHFVPVGGRDIDGVSAANDASVIDENIDSAAASNDFRSQTRNQDWRRDLHHLPLNTIPI
jgi:hypothetical protein